MNDVLENSYTWTGSFVEAINKLTCDVANLIFASLSITSNTSCSTGSATTNTNSKINSVASDEKILLHIPQVLQDAVSLFACDDFQFLLLKIFITICLSNIGFIYIAWYIYGTRITDRFMSPSTSPDDLKKRVLQLKLPREHSQRYS